MAKKRRGNEALLDRWWKKHPRVYLRYHAEHEGKGHQMIQALFAAGLENPRSAAARVANGIRA